MADERRTARLPVALSGDLLRCTCWCEAKLVLVRQADVRRGITGSCGDRDCRPPV